VHVPALVFYRWYRFTDDTDLRRRVADYRLARSD
jgi:hypothetical protein